SDMMMDAPWTVAFIERPNHRSPDEAGAARIAAALKLAEQLGGATVVLTGDDLIGTVLDYARQNNVTQIVVGKSHASRLRALLGRALIPALVERVSGAALHIVTEEAHVEPEAGRPLAPAKAMPWRGHLVSVGLVAVAGGLA